MVMSDPEGKIVLVNTQMERLFGYSRDELLGQSRGAARAGTLPDQASGFPHEFLRPTRGASHGQQGATCMVGARTAASSPSKSASTRSRAKRAWWYSVPSWTSPNASGRRVALRRLNDELEQGMHRLSEANRELKSKTQENEAFVYSVSHDLRSPLVNLQGFSKELSRAMQPLRADLVESDLPQPVRDRELAILDGPMAKATHFIQTAVTRLSGIIDALLRLSRAGRVVYQRRCVDVQAIVTRIIDSLRGTAEERGATIETGDLPAALGDPAAVEQIFANLIGNALNYLDRKRPGRIEVGSLGPEQDNAGAGLRTYYVRDNGLGITEAG